MVCSQQAMHFLCYHVVVKTTGFAFSGHERTALASLLTASTSARSLVCVLAPLFVAHSRLTRAESKRRSGLNPAVRRDGGRDFDPQREQGVTADLAKRDLPASIRWPPGTRAYMH